MIKGRQLKPESPRGKSGQRLNGRLTPRRKEILECIRSLTERNHYPPTLRELKLALGLNSFSTVWLHLKQLEFGGYIVRDRNTSRSIRLVGYAGEMDAAVGRLAKALNLRYGLAVLDQDIFDLLHQVQACLVPL